MPLSTGALIRLSPPSLKLPVSRINAYQCLSTLAFCVPFWSSILLSTPLSSSPPSFLVLTTVFNAFFSLHPCPVMYLCAINSLSILCFFLSAMNMLSG
ncbi:hypothetical protein FB45DRAFT_929765 [Roridomyces roridus]|uniref:Uncharacterized protein n=1 Tax=Roridomyces roridus TaxID=1738132 RepID=A0AAD7FEU8_9AGAR|nr:hypothetical protein FB45DRAFT_945837 [Roridomyces roridus]KAJ7616046.1 hypothetical protein FB45DRAFT_935167 [Roridomyces roridus]KAJ7616124.1 hypothetical protein FB45DRAFT_935315 [Roridomyces roridus]KAJ7619310.1 hypothetical protein FB45DRAFT_930416 [Roridomyces roridus]KAJ7620233.1 hypothetical protein FB45DRAFT_929765 [Roridomyces roridus]